MFLGRDLLARRFFSVKLSKFDLQQPQTRTLRHGAVVELEVVSFLLFFFVGDIARQENG